MFLHVRNVPLCAGILLLTFASSTALFCSDLASTDDHSTPCFLQTPTKHAVALRTSGNSLVLPCHVAHTRRSTVEWWYSDAQKLANYKIYPVYPPVRPTVLRFVSSVTPQWRGANESDVLDASILLRHVNVDDSGVYRCVIRPWSSEQPEASESPVPSDDSNWPSLSYQVQSTAPRLCQPGAGALPCFAAMRTSSPTVLDAYHSAFLQCVVKNQQRSSNVFWVVGDSSVNNVLITDHLTSNQHAGDRLRRVFPLSPADYSIELTVNRTVPERVYSCVIDGATDRETTLFTYIVRSIDLEQAQQHAHNSSAKLPAHDTLNSDQIQTLHQLQKVEQEQERDSAEPEEQTSESEEETTASQ